MKRGEVKKAVYRYLDSLNHPCIMGGWALRNVITKTTGYEVYPTVVLKIAKNWAYMSCGAFDCIDKQRSIYQFKPGKKISGTYSETLPIGSNVKEYRAIRSI